MKDNEKKMQRKKNLEKVTKMTKIVRYNLEIKHNFNFKDSKMLVYMDKTFWKLLESGIISK